DLLFSGWRRRPELDPWGDWLERPCEQVLDDLQENLLRPIWRHRPELNARRNREQWSSQQVLNDLGERLHPGFGEPIDLIPWWQGILADELNRGGLNPRAEGERRRLTPRFAVDLLSGREHVLADELDRTGLNPRAERQSGRQSARLAVDLDTRR